MVELGHVNSGPCTGAVFPSPLLKKLPCALIERVDPAPFSRHTHDFGGPYMWVCVCANVNVCVCVCLCVYVYLCA
jgi:hypothetical protein